MSESFKEIRKLLGENVSSANTNEFRIETLEGGHVEFWTLENPDAGRSRRYDEVIIDEAGLVLELRERWRESIRPTLIDRKGRAWFFGTPKPPRSIQLKDYAFYEFYQRGIVGLDGWKSFHQPTVKNPFLSPDEIEAMRREPGMTSRVARQEIDAEFLKESPDALWTMAMIEPFRGVRPKEVKAVQTVLFWDPGNFSPRESADPSGIVIATKGDNGHYYIENDLSGSYSPNYCARLIIGAAAHYGASVFYESNQGGQYLKAALRQVSRIPVTAVLSTRGKEQRATAPLSAYEMGQVHHAAELFDMENEMVTWNPYDSKLRSPNRMDALVGALNVLMKGSSTGLRRTEWIGREE